jgi:hypothetical protein
VFRYLGTDVLERRAREAEAAERALEARDVSPSS